MNPAVWAALGGAVSVLLVLLGAALAAHLAGRRGAERERVLLSAAQADVEALQRRVEELSSELKVTGQVMALRPQAEYVITNAGESTDVDVPHVPDRAVLSVTLGEPLVKVAAFGYGLRRALSAESRNRIGFQMRREVRRARKERRRSARRTRVAAAHREESAA